MQAILDTNVFVEDFYFQSPPYVAFLDYIQKTDVLLLMPEVVLKELRSKYRQNLIEKVQSLQKAEKELQRLLPEDNFKPKIVDIEVATEAYMADILRKIGIGPQQIISAPQGALNLLIDKAINRKKPFTPRGEEFRDALLWEHVKFALEESEEQTILFISNDVSAFGYTNDREATLHPDLMKEIDDCYTAKSRPSSTKYSLSPYVSYFLSVRKFVEAHHTPIKAINLDWLQQRIPTKTIAEEIGHALDGRAELSQRLKDYVFKLEGLPYPVDTLILSYDSIQPVFINFSIYASTPQSLLILFTIYSEAIATYRNPFDFNSQKVFHYGNSTLNIVADMAAEYDGSKLTGVTVTNLYVHNSP